MHENQAKKVKNQREVHNNKLLSPRASRNQRPNPSLQTYHSSLKLLPT